MGHIDGMLRPTASARRRQGPLLRPQSQRLQPSPPDAQLRARPASLLSAFHDVGGPAGATSTRVSQYLRAAKLVPGPSLATALFYGIKSDTRDLVFFNEAATAEIYTSGKVVSREGSWR